MPLVVTHTEGFLACFTQEADGSMRQRALIDTGEASHTPSSLADLGVKLAGEYGWTFDAPLPKPVAPKPKAVAHKPKALPRTQRPKQIVKHADGTLSSADDPSVADRYALITEYLRVHGEAEMLDVIAGVGLEPTPARAARWHHQFNALLASNVLAYRIFADNGRTKVYRLADAEP